MARRIVHTLAGLAVGAAMVWLGWHPGSANPAIGAARGTIIAVVLVLAALPWALRPIIGPVAGHRVARVVRTAGFLAVYAFLLIMVGLSRYAGSRFDHFQAFDQENWESDVRSGAVVSAVLMVVVIGGYAAAVLIATASRIPVAPRALAFGAGLGAGAALIVYALMPLGNPWHLNNKVFGSICMLVLFLVLPVAFWMAGRRGSSMAGLYAGVTAALVLSVLSIGTMLLLPSHVDLIWANPDPYVEHGTDFELRMTVGDTAIKYQLGMFLLPLAGWILGVFGRYSASQPEAAQPQPAQPLLEGAASGI